MVDGRIVGEPPNPGPWPGVFDPAVFEMAAKCADLLGWGKTADVMRQAYEQAALRYAEWAEADLIYREWERANRELARSRRREEEWARTRAENSALLPYEDCARRMFEDALVEYPALDGGSWEGLTPALWVQWCSRARSAAEFFRASEVAS